MAGCSFQGFNPVLVLAIIGGVKLLAAGLFDLLVVPEGGLYSCIVAMWVLLPGPCFGSQVMAKNGGCVVSGHTALG